MGKGAVPKQSIMGCTGCDAQVRVSGTGHGDLPIYLPFPSMILPSLPTLPVPLPPTTIQLLSLPLYLTPRGVEESAARLLKLLNDRRGATSPQWVEEMYMQPVYGSGGAGTPRRSALPQSITAPELPGRSPVASQMMRREDLKGGDGESSSLRQMAVDETPFVMGSTGEIGETVAFTEGVECEEEGDVASVNDGTAGQGTTGEMCHNVDFGPEDTVYGERYVADGSWAP